MGHSSSSLSDGRDNLHLFRHPPPPLLHGAHGPGDQDHVPVTQAGPDVPAHLLCDPRQVPIPLWA